MNQERRKRLEIILEQLESIQSTAEEILDEEEHYRDSVPEGLQDSEQYKQSDAVCDDLSDALDGLADAVSSVVSAIAEYSKNKNSRSAISSKKVSGSSEKSLKSWQ